MKKNKFLVVLATIIGSIATLSTLFLIPSNNQNKQKVNYQTANLVLNSTRTSNSTSNTILEVDVSTIITLTKQPNAPTGLKILNNLNNYFAQEFLSTSLKVELESYYHDFVSEIIQIINHDKNYNYFFNVTYPSAPSSTNQIVVDSSTNPTKVELVSLGDFSKIKVTCYRLDTNLTSYVQDSFIIKGFNIAAQTNISQTSFSVQNFPCSFPDEPNVKKLGDIDVINFLSKQNVEPILKDYINKNISTILLNYFNMTECSYLSPLIKVEDDNILISFKIKNYIENGELIFKELNQEFNITLYGFAPRKLNNITTDFKQNLTVTDIEKNYKLNNSFDVLGNLSKYLIEEFLPYGYLNTEFIDQLINAINTNPSFWIVNPVDDMINIARLPIAKKSNNIKISILNSTTSTGTINKQLQITIPILCVPKYADTMITQDYPYTEKIFTISGDFGKNCLNEGSTSLNITNNNTLINLEKNIDVDDPKYHLGKLKNLSIEAIDDAFSSGLVNKESFLKKNIGEFINLYKNVIFNNVLTNSTYRIMMNTSKWSNNVLTINLRFTNNYFDKTVLKEGNNISPSQLFTLHFRNFKHEDHTKERNLIIILSVVIGTLLLATLIAIIVIIYLKKKRNKQRKNNINTYSNWKE